MRAGEPLLLVHCATQAPLCLEAGISFPTDFGVEHEVGLIWGADRVVDEVIYTNRAHSSGHSTRGQQLLQGQGRAWGLIVTGIPAVMCREVRATLLRAACMSHLCGLCSGLLCGQTIDPNRLYPLQVSAHLATGLGMQQGLERLARVSKKTRACFVPGWRSRIAVCCSPNVCGSLWLSSQRRNQYLKLTGRHCTVHPWPVQS